MSARYWLQVGTFVFTSLVYVRTYIKYIDLNNT